MVAWKQMERIKFSYLFHSCNFSLFFPPCFSPCLWGLSNTFFDVAPNYSFLFQISISNYIVQKSWFTTKTTNNTSKIHPIPKSSQQYFGGLFFKHFFLCNSFMHNIFKVSQGITMIIASLMCLSSSHRQSPHDRLQTAMELTSQL
jgi:hypothetical protein